MHYEVIDIGICHYNNVSITYNDNTGEAIATCFFTENTECISKLATIVTESDESTWKHVEIGHGKHMKFGVCKLERDTLVQLSRGDGLHSTRNIQNQLELKWAAKLYKKFSLSARCIFNDVSVNYLYHEDGPKFSVWFRSVTIELSGHVHAID